MTPEMTTAYLYGISDFWLTMVEDPAIGDALLQSDLTVFASMYSQFLQTTSGMSLDDIAVATRSDLRLVPILRQVPLGYRADGTPWPEEISLVLPEPYQSIRFLSNQPLLPTLLLSEGADYVVDEKMVDGAIVSTVTFARPLVTIPIPYRVVSYQGQPYYLYMLWAQDCALDLQLISKVYAPLVEQTPQVSTSLFKRFIQGLMYLYTNGPTLTNLRNGLCLAFGIPVTRMTGEIVLLTGQNSQTGNHWVMTTLDTYTLPYGIAPTVEVDGTPLPAGTALASMIEVDDWLTKENWWLNMYIPPNVLGTYPGGDGVVATPGSDADNLMREFLKTHLFVVNITWHPGRELGDASKLAPILRRAKPAHTFGLIVVTQNLGDDEIVVADDESHALVLKLRESMVPPGYIRRAGDGNEEVVRNTPVFVRANLDSWGAARFNDPVSPPDTSGDDPAFTVAAPDALTGGGPLNTTVGKLRYFYACTEAEARAKLTHAGLTPPVEFPYALALTGAYAADPVLLTRSLLALPATGDYQDTGTDLGTPIGDGFATEILHHYYEPVSNPVTLVLVKPTPTLDVVSVYVVDASPGDLVLPIPQLDTLSAYYYDGNNPLNTKHTLVSGA